jgi:glycogen debranching enzyme
MHDSLRFQANNLTLYNAGLPRFPRNFTRDSVISALLAEDVAMMRDQLIFCAQHMGTKKDPLTGEEFGKVHHEWPGYPLREKMTTYNACDGAAFFLIGQQWLVEKTGSRDLVEQLSAEIHAATTYIQTHLNDDNLFEESPRYCGAEHFALKVTYWKDSVMIDRPDGEPHWPAVFTMAHVQNLCGLRCAAKLLDSAELQSIADKMHAALDLLWDDDLGTFYAMRDQQGMVSAVTSDALHALFYLDVGDLSAERIASIERSSEALETSVGYLVMTPEDASRMNRPYHSATVWPFEQALIDIGAGKFGLARVQRVCRRVLRAIDLGDPEAVEVQIIKDSALSCDPQLWTIAAKQYFITRK